MTSLDGEEFLLSHDSITTDNKNMGNDFCKYFILSKLVRVAVNKPVFEMAEPFCVPHACIEVKFYFSVKDNICRSIARQYSTVRILNRVAGRDAFISTAIACRLWNKIDFFHEQQYNNCEDAGSNNYFVFAKVKQDCHC